MNKEVGTIGHVPDGDKETLTKALREAAEKPTLTVSQVNDAVSKAGGIQPPQKTQKQLEKEKKQQEHYWNSMISRKETVDMIQRAVAQTAQAQGELIKLMYIQVNTLTEFILSKGLATREELDELSKPIADMVYGRAKEPDKKDEKGQESTKKGHHKERKTAHKKDEDKKEHSEVPKTE